MNREEAETFYEPDEDPAEVFAWFDNGPPDGTTAPPQKEQETGMTTLHPHELERDFGGTGPRPRIVCLCGSTRFYEQYQQANYDRTMAGEIVLSVGFYPHAKAEHGHGEGVGHDSEQKIMLDELHKRKIDLADYVLVVSDITGYYGSSTLSEIRYALAHGKPVEFTEPAARERFTQQYRDLLTGGTNMTAHEIRLRFRSGKIAVTCPCLNAWTGCWQSTYWPGRSWANPAWKGELHHGAVIEARMPFPAAEVIAGWEAWHRDRGIEVNARAYPVVG